MAVQAHLKLVGTVLASGLLALAVPISHFGQASTESHECGSLGRTSTFENEWSNFGPYDQTDAIWRFKGSPVGLYVAHHQGQPIGLFSLFVNGDLSAVRSFEVADPRWVFRSNKKTLDKVGRVQSYLRWHWLGYDPNDANAQASQLAIWSVVHDHDYTRDLVQGAHNVQVWSRYIHHEVRQIRKSAPDAFPSPPFRINTRLLKKQWRGYIGLAVSGTDLRRNVLKGLRIIASTPGTTSSAITDSKGEATVYLPDPAPGWSQTYKAEWNSVFPAGTLLRVVYQSKHKTPQDARPDYVVTAQPMPVRAWVTGFLPDDWCNS
jgi:hypothetical protein